MINQYKLKRDWLARNEGIDIPSSSEPFTEDEWQFVCDMPVRRRQLMSIDVYNTQINADWARSLRQILQACFYFLPKSVNGVAPVRRRLSDSDFCRYALLHMDSYIKNEEWNPNYAIRRLSMNMHLRSFQPPSLSSLKSQWRKNLNGEIISSSLLCRAAANIEELLFKLQTEPLHKVSPSVVGSINDEYLRRNAIFFLFAEKIQNAYARRKDKYINQFFRALRPHAEFELGREYDQYDREAIFFVLNADFVEDLLIEDEADFQKFEKELVSFSRDFSAYSKLHPWFELVNSKVRRLVRNLKGSGGKTVAATLREKLKDIDRIAELHRQRRIARDAVIADARQKWVKSLNQTG